MESTATAFFALRLPETETGCGNAKAAPQVNSSKNNVAVTVLLPIQAGTLKCFKRMGTKPTRSEPPASHSHSRDPRVIYRQQPLFLARSRKRTKVNKVHGEFAYMKSTVCTFWLTAQ
jgi:hypothetical protein